MNERLTNIHGVEDLEKYKFLFLDEKSQLCCKNEIRFNRHASCNYVTHVNDGSLRVPCPLTGIWHYLLPPTSPKLEAELYRKNHWLDRRRSKTSVQFRFQIIGLTPPCVVNLKSCNFGGLEVSTSNTQFGNYVSSNPPLGSTYADGYLEVFQQGICIETWALTNITLISYGVSGVAKAKDLTYEITLTCSNKSQITSKYFKII